MLNLSGPYILNGGEYVLESHLVTIGGLMEFMREVVYGKDLPPASASAKNAYYPVRKEFLKHLKHFHLYVGNYSSQYHYHPLLGFFFEQYSQHPICGYTHMTHGGKHSWKYMIEIFGDFIQTLRQHAMLAGIKKSVSDWESKIDRQREGLMELERALFKKHRRILVVRLDLKHLAAYFNLAELQEFMREDERVRGMDYLALMEGQWAYGRDVKARVTFNQVRLDRHHFFSNMKGKPRLFRHLIGYAWCIEFTPGAGYHLHAVLMFNGSRVQKHVWMAGQIGRYWEKQITGGRGAYENVNRRWDLKDAKCGIGMVFRNDHRKRQILREKVLGYLAKDSQMVLALPYKGCHAFGKSHLPTVDPRRGGRPVSSKNQLIESSCPASPADPAGLYECCPDPTGIGPRAFSSDSFSVERPENFRPI